MCGLRCLVVCVLAFGVSVCGDLWAQSASALWPDLTSPAATTGGGEKDAALIVAVGDYAFVPDIPGAEDNALAWSLYLSKTRGVPWVKVLVNQQGTREKVWKYLEQAARAVQPATAGAACLVARSAVGCIYVLGQWPSACRAGRLHALAHAVDTFAANRRVTVRRRRCSQPGLTLIPAWGSTLRCVWTGSLGKGSPQAQTPCSH